MPPVWLRYPRLYWSFARYCLMREMAFRVNFIARCVASVSWLILLILFFHLVFRQTDRIGDWNHHQYLFFMGTGFILNGLTDILFIENCTDLAEQIRTGDLDFALLKPIDEQFLLSFRKVDWAELPNVMVGIGLLLYSCRQVSVPITFAGVVSYSVLMGAGLAILFGMMLMMAASSVWIIRTQGMYEIWWYVTQFARYPADIYWKSPAGLALSFVLTFVFPVLLAVNIPARYGVGLLTGEFTWLVAYLFLAAGVVLLVSRRFFFFALRAYRSASS